MKTSLLKTSAEQNIIDKEEKMYGCRDRKTDDYFDLETLKCVKTKMDHLIDFVRNQNDKKIQKMLIPSLMFDNFNVITSDVILEFKNEARSHIQYLLDNGKEHKTLYWLNDNLNMFNKMEITYEEFMLMHDKQNILDMIERIASDFFPKHTLKFKITCLYLIYFYALLVNKNATWILMDYLNFGNKHHQYFIRMNQ